MQTKKWERILQPNRLRVVTNRLEWFGWFFFSQIIFEHTFETNFEMRIFKTHETKTPATAPIICCGDAGIMIKQANNISIKKTIKQTYKEHNKQIPGKGAKNLMC